MMTRLLLAIAAIAAITVLALATGDENYNTERTAQVQAQQTGQTERTAIVEAGQTDRAGINAYTLQWQAQQEAQTMRLALLAFVGVAVFGMATVVIVVALKRPGQPALPQYPSQVPQPSAALLQMWRWYPAHELQYNDSAQQWMLVAQDGVYMLESDIVTQPRRITQR